jgi:hypothetical protein
MWSGVQVVQLCQALRLSYVRAELGGTQKVHNTVSPLATAVLLTTKTQKTSNK